MVVWVLFGILQNFEQFSGNPVVYFCPPALKCVSVGWFKCSFLFLSSQEDGVAGQVRRCHIHKCSSLLASLHQFELLSLKHFKSEIAVVSQKRMR